MIQKTRTTLLLLAATFAISTPAFSQAPSEAQREAIKSNCRNDYIAHCSSIPPGGAASLQCLQKNMASLSSACAGAVKAAAPAETKAEPAAAPTAPKEEPKQETKSEPAPAAAPAKSAAEPAKSETKAVAAPAGKPSQRADFRDPQQLPFRLSQGLRGRADRRRCRAGMPGEEQGKTLGGLREGGCCRGRRCRSGGQQLGTRQCQCGSGSRRRRRGSRGGACPAGAAPDAAARNPVRGAIGLRA